MVRYCLGPACHKPGKPVCLSLSRPYFTTDMLRVVCVSGEHQDQSPTAGNPAHDAFGPVRSYFNVARCEPAIDPDGIDMVTSRVRGGLIFTRMANKDVGLHGRLRTS